MVHQRVSPYAPSPTSHYESVLLAGRDTFEDVRSPPNQPAVGRSTVIETPTQHRGGLPRRGVGSENAREGAFGDDEVIVGQRRLEELRW